MKVKIAVVGLGGVGGWATYLLYKAGVRNFTLFDGDVVSPSNINRQFVALTSTIGKKKVAVMKDFLSADSSASVTALPYFIRGKNGKVDKPLLDNERYIDSVKDILKECDYIVDAIDNVNDKISLIALSKVLGVPIISSMGMARKRSPLMIKTTLIEKTTICPLARVVRARLRKLGISAVECVYSTEQPYEAGSNCFVVGAAGAAIADTVIKNILNTTGSTY